MNKGQLIDKVSKEFNLDRVSAKQLVECILESMVEVLMSGKRIEMRGFGVLKLKKLKGTFVKNPRNGIEVFVGERYTVRFKPSKRLLERLNEKA
jgi:nucleoid DNA-binding protein